MLWCQALSEISSTAPLSLLLLALKGVYIFSTVVIPLE